MILFYSGVEVIRDPNTESVLRNNNIMMSYTYTDIRKATNKRFRAILKHRRKRTK